ncbi:MAG: hypothetical protein E7194_11045 [Erysipelotrichaceae bacterium]|nr:hypothetical protein [Erysipelotrichaceae bacterium]
MIVTTAMLKKKYSDYANPLDKIRREANRGTIIRLNRGIYETDPEVSPWLLASSILSPSYLSFDFVLSYYGLIPEKVVSITSASLQMNKSLTYTNHFARYEYSDVPASAFSEGIGYIEEDGYTVKIASKEKAICDSLYKWRVVHSVRKLKELLFVDKRIDEDEFGTCDFILMERLAGLYHRRNHELLIKLIRKEYTDG